MNTRHKNFRIDFTTSSKELEQELKNIADQFENVWDVPDSWFSNSIDLNYPTQYILALSQRNHVFDITFMQYKKMLTAKGIGNVVYYGTSFTCKSLTGMFEQQKMLLSLFKFLYATETFPVDQSLNEVANLCEFDPMHCTVVKSNNNEADYGITTLSTVQMMFKRKPENE
jgi:hypothetical protein